MTGVDETTASQDTPAAADECARELLARGYCVLRGLLPDTVRALDRDLAEDFARTPFCEGGFYGTLTRRFGRLLTRSPHAGRLVLDPLVCAVAEQVLSPWCDTLQLNLTQGIAVHPGALPQLPHRDQDMWRGAVGETEYLVNVMWPFTRYTRENGATLVWPGSHGRKALETDPPEHPAVAIEMEPGDALLFLGSTLHGAGGNHSDRVRRGCIVSYCLGWLKPYENQWLAYPPEVARGFSSELAGLVGYRQHRPNLGNYEGRCPSILLGGPPPARLGAIDALRPDQAATIAEHVERQRRGDG